MENNSRLGVIITVVFVAVIWIVYLYQLVFNIEPYGILPHEKLTLLHIFVYPLFHGDITHIMNNTYSMIFLFYFLFSSYSRSGLLSIVLIWIGSGIFIWFLGEHHTNHIGASGLIYGACAFLITSGFVRKDSDSRSLAIMSFLLFGAGMLTGFAPSKGISWEGHAGGALMGIICAILFRKMDVHEEQKSIKIYHTFERFDVQQKLKEIENERKQYLQNLDTIRYVYGNDLPQSSTAPADGNIPYKDEDNTQ